MLRALALSTVVLAAGAAPAGAAKPKIPNPPLLRGAVAADGAVTLVRAQGKQPVVAIHPGWYTVTVSDLSKDRGFHLRGPGVDKTTGVRFDGAVMWGVHFRPGTYRFSSGSTARTFRVG